MRDDANSLTAYLLRYHPHIDGLRAVAIVSVVACHIGLPGFSGGYVGVDVFFVISGFLIITQIVGGLNQGTFTLSGFWSRRALRILPPMLVVLAASVAIGCLVDVTADEFVILGQEAFSSALMAVNFFLLQRQGYFDDLLTTKPFLHLWSLAVEEQFYLLAPLILLLGVPLYRRRKMLAATLVGIAFAASLAACIYLSQKQPALAFFMMPTRAWEFIAGGCIGLAVPRIRRVTFLGSGFLGVLGFLLIAVCVVSLPPDSSYPSYLATLPVIGSVLMIADGLAFPKAIAARVLASGPVVWIGLVSYAWYLWHWPLIVFAREYQFGHLELWQGLGLAALSLLLAWLTRILVEKPIRQWRRKHGPSLGWGPVVYGSLASIALGALLLAPTALLAGRAPQFGMGAVPNAGPCRLDQMNSPQECLAAVGGAPLGLLIGDSHGEAGYGTLAGLAAAHHSALATMTIGGCMGVLYDTPFDTGTTQVANCANSHAKVIELLAQRTLPLKFAILETHWELYLGDGLMPDGLPRHLIGANSARVPADDQERTFVDGLRATFDLLQRGGAERILVVASAPDLLQVDCFPRAEKQGLDADMQCAEPRKIVDANRAVAIRALREAVAGYTNVRLADPIAAFCNAESCISRKDGAPLYYDTNHLNTAGEALATGYLHDDLDWVFGGT